jgi:ABC-type multidrug transport system ATPase subunit
VAIARALLTDPRILILDDSTSSVDVATESQIQAALEQLMVGRTSFVIAQRISTVRNADQILVLDKGRIAASGTHDELLESSEIYSQIYSSQLVDDSVATGSADGAALVGAGRNGAHHEMDRFEDVDGVRQDVDQFEGVDGVHHEMAQFEAPDVAQLEGPDGMSEPSERLRSGASDSDAPIPGVRHP